jgi:2,5-diamino-6-(ribosylamino)-4(3H)-pyrimidinone 5'-phosphate reductase
MYNSVSVDGAIKDFCIDTALHYEVASKYNADAFLVGSNTAKTGIEMFNETVPFGDSEVTSQQEPNANGPYWIIVDSKGILKGKLHHFRQSGYCKDVIVLVSKKTPKPYLEYLKAEKFEFIVAGSDFVDYQFALQEAYDRFGVHTILTDSGGTLSNVLLELGLIDELHLLLNPFIVGKKAVNLFRALKSQVQLKLIKTEQINEDYVLVAYKIKCLTQSE